MISFNQWRSEYIEPNTNYEYIYFNALPLNITAIYFLGFMSALLRPTYYGISSASDEGYWLKIGTNHSPLNEPVLNVIRCLCIGR